MNNQPKLYQYLGIDHKSKVLQKLKSASSLTEAKKQISAEKITLLKIKRISTTKLNASKKKLLEFFAQLTFMLGAKIPLNQTLQTLADLEKNSLWQSILLTLNHTVSQGKSLSQAMQQFPQLFTKPMLIFTKNGETSGQLVKTLEKLTELLGFQQQNKANFKKAMSYPLLLLLCTIFTAIGIVFLILPQYQQLFLELNTPLPWFTLALLNCCQWLKANSLLIVLTLIAVTFCIKYTTHLSWFQYYLDNILLQLPGLGLLLKQHYLNQWSYLLSVGLGAKLPLLSIIPLANQVINNLYLQAQLSKLHTHVQNGENLYNSMQTTHIFSLIALKMVKIGETTGTLGLVFSKIAKDYQTCLEARLHKLSKYTEPTALLILAVVCGLLIAALYMPLMHLGLTT